MAQEEHFGKQFENHLQEMAFHGFGFHGDHMTVQGKNFPVVASTFHPPGTQPGISKGYSSLWATIPHESGNNFEMHVGVDHERGHVSSYVDPPSGRDYESPEGHRAGYGMGNGPIQKAESENYGKTLHHMMNTEPMPKADELQRNATDLEEMAYEHPRGHTQVMSGPGAGAGWYDHRSGTYKGA